MKKFLKGCCRCTLMLLAAAAALGITGAMMGGDVRALDLGSDWLDWGSGWAPGRRGGYAQAGDFSTSQGLPSAAQPTSVGADAGRWAGVTQLDFDLGTMNLELVEGDEFSIRQAGELPAYSDTVEDGVWVLESSGVKWRGEKMGTLTVTYPRGTVFERVDLDIGMGTLTVNGLQANDLYAAVGMGKGTMTGVAVSGDATFSADMGELTVTGSVGGDATLSAGMGQLDYQGPLGGLVEMDCGMGELTVTTPQPAQYGYTVDCGMGTVSIGGNKYSGLSSDVTVDSSALPFFSINCGMGTAKVAFTKN